MNDQIALDSATLLAAASEQTGGLTDLGSESIHDRLEILLEMIEGARLTPDGRRIARETVIKVLVKRLSFQQDRHLNPGIDQERIESPLIVTGIARSGTTFFYSLIAQDPGSRSPRHWEISHPSPPPGLATPNDPRILESNRDRFRYHYENPEQLRAHPYSDEGGLSMTECEGFLALDLRNVSHGQFQPIPNMLTKRPLSTDYLGNYGFHRAFLQQLQYGAPRRRWALKGTQHHYHLSEVFETYPDAMVLWVHRDPARVLPSMLELVSLIQETRTKKVVDRPKLARYVLAGIDQDLNRAIEDPLANDERVFHVRYHDLREDPVAGIRAIYKRYDLPFSEEFERLMREWTENNTVDRYGKFEYSAADFDLSADSLHTRYAAYRERFDIPVE